jgi:hypothetical protein
MAPRSPRAGKSLRRPVGTRPPRKTLLVFCEGERTEPEYLAALRREPAVREVAAVEIMIEMSSAGAVPLTLVTRAVTARSRARSEKSEIDEFWCVFDVEWPRNHPALKEAVALAAEHDIKLAISNPCFELWLALHFGDHDAFLDNAEARRLRRQHDGATDKGLDPARYMPLRKAAVARAARLEQRHARNGSGFPHDNPSSGMHRLIASVEGVGAP